VTVEAGGRSSVEATTVGEPLSQAAQLSGAIDRRAQLHRLPSLTRAAFAIVWRASPRLLMSTLLLQVFAAVGVALQLLVAKRLLFTLVSGGSGAEAYRVVAAFAGVIAVIGALGALIARQQRLLVEMVGVHAFDRIIGVSSTVEFKLFEDPTFYDRLQRAKNSASFRSIDMVTSISTLVTAVVTSLGIAVVLFSLEPILVAFVVVAALPQLAATILNSRHSYVFEYAMTGESRERAYLMEILTENAPAKEIRLFDAAEFLRRRYHELTRARLRHLRVFLRRRLTIAVVGALATAAGTALSLAALVYLIETNRIGVASALTAGLAMQQLASRASTASGSIGKLVESGLFIDDYAAFLQLAQAAHTDHRPANAAAVSQFGSLNVENLSFRYPGTDHRVLDDVSVELRAGEVVALVGENGSGKTTLVKLICELYEPDSGRIVWTGSDGRPLDPADVRAKTTVLFQDYVQYHLSVYDNIGLGRTDRNDDREAVEAAAADAGATAFIERLPAGFETRLGRKFYGGQELSGGQWQRLALARAFFRGGDFLILDEPTAALDARAEHELFNQMRRLAGGKSVLLVSHRFSSVRSADRIYVLSGGRVTESGTHDELMARAGQYAELFNLQAAAYLGKRTS
jgi:ATP-binding cassette, subfamily B, bacterial